MRQKRLVRYFIAPAPFKERFHHRTCALHTERGLLGNILCLEKDARWVTTPVECYLHALLLFLTTSISIVLSHRSFPFMLFCWDVGCPRRRKTPNLGRRKVRQLWITYILYRHYPYYINDWFVFLLMNRLLELCNVLRARSDAKSPAKFAIMIAIPRASAW